MPQSFEQYLAKKQETSKEETSPKKYPPFIEKKLQKIEEESSLILEKIKEITGGKIKELTEEELEKVRKAVSLEELKKLKELLLEKKKIEKGEYGTILEVLEINQELAQERLKKTKLWDKEKQQWNWYMDENQELRDSDRFSYSQLLGIIAEALVVIKEK